MDIQSNVVTITPEPGRELKLEEIPLAIAGAGFRPAEMMIRARGRFEDDGFRISGWRRALTVQGVPPTDTAEQEVQGRVEAHDGRLVLLLPSPR